jgi:hypothetical protein
LGWCSQPKKMFRDRKISGGKPQYLRLEPCNSSV